jgi:hypothetical protein
MHEVHDVIMTSHSMNLHKVHKTPQPKNMLNEYPLLRFAKGGEGGEKGTIKHVRKES